MLPPRRWIIAVETTDDPAYARVARAAAAFPDVGIELVLAGIAASRAQKCTNILAAIEHLTPSDEYVVLFDADIRPQQWWLAGLIAPLAGGRADIVNGYRWPVPLRLTPEAVIGTALDRAIAVLVRLWDFRAVWGGSIALPRAILERLDLPAILDRAATEDTAIGSRAAALGLRVLTRRGLRLPTPMPGDFGTVWRFARRQYQLVRIYRPRLWLFAFAVAAFDLLSRAVLVAAACGAAGPPRWIALGDLAVLGASGSAAAQLRFSIGRRLGVRDRPAFVAAHHLLVWLFLPGVAFHFGAIAAGFVYSPIVWAHVRYTIDRSGRVNSAVRSAHE